MSKVVLSQKNRLHVEKKTSNLEILPATLSFKLLDAEWTFGQSSP